MKIRLEYKKDKQYIFLSALDIERMWERILRRSGLKLKFTEGYNPKVVKDFSPAIPLGIISESEVLDFFITENLTLEAILEKIEKVSPWDLTIKKAKIVDENSPSLSSTITHIKISIIGKEAKKIDFSKLNIKKKFELKKFIINEKEDENGKNLIVDSKVSLKNLFCYFLDRNLEFTIIKRENFTNKDNKIKPIFDLD